MKSPYRKAVYIEEQKKIQKAPRTVPDHNYCDICHKEFKHVKSIIWFKGKFRCHHCVLACSQATLNGLNIQHKDLKVGGKLLNGLTPLFPHNPTSPNRGKGRKNG
jgi:hypothetical protein